MTTTTNPLAWRLADLPSAPTGPVVWSCFHCGGGSSMGYKLAGCKVLGGVDIDKRMVAVYRANLKPELSFISDIRTAPLPDRDVDILDGSPPCTSFSTAGVREKGWGKEKAFNEGAAKQRLDDLFFAFIDYASKVRPRVIIAENVTGMLAGNARAYVRRIKEAFETIGYSVQLFRLTAAHFGVPQARERVFFVAQRIAHARPLQIKATTTRVTTVAEATADIETRGDKLTPRLLRLWHTTPPGRNNRFSADANGSFGGCRINSNSVAPTLCAGSTFQHWSEPCHLSDRALARIQSFPDDYDFGKQKAMYVCGMSVPPFMMRGIASQIVAQAF